MKKLSWHLVITFFAACLLTFPLAFMLASRLDRQSKIYNPRDSRPAPSLETSVKHSRDNAPPVSMPSEFRPQTWEERLRLAAHEYWRIKAHADLARLGIPVTRYDPTTSDVQLSLKMKGGRVRTDFDPNTPLAKGEVIDISDQWDPMNGDNPTIKIKGKLFLQLTMKLADQKRLFSSYPQRNYLPIPEDSRKVLRFKDSLDVIALGMHDYNRDNTHIWPGIPHSYLYAPPGTPYDPEHPPVIRGDGFPYIQRGHLTLARRETSLSNTHYQALLKRIEGLKGSGAIKIGYDMGTGRVETVTFEDIWLKINPYNGEPTHILKKCSLIR